MSNLVDSWLKLPTLDDTDQQVIDWMNRHLDYTSPRRRWQTQAAALKLWFYLGRQWIVARTALAAHNGGYHFEDIHRESSAAFPQPVTNLIAPAVDNWVARLSRKEYTPDADAGRKTPEYLAAARLAKHIMSWEMRREDWGVKREALCFNLVIEAVSNCRTWWDENDVEQTLVASPDAVKCVACGRMFASPMVDPKMAAFGILPPDAQGQVLPFQHSETLKEEPGSSTDARMIYCPYCSQLALLKPFDMSEEEAGSSDAFGAPMGKVVPSGQPCIEPISIHEYYPQNGGLGLEPHEQKVFSQVKVRNLEWIALRVPELRDTLKAESPQQLLRYNPLYADRIFQGGGGGYGLGSGYEAYYNHARMFEVTVEPQPIPGLEEGAWFIKVNDKIVRRPLCMKVDVPEGEPVLVPRSKYHFARFKRMPGNYWGRSFVDDMIPLQRRLNELDAQGIDLRERGKPSMWVPEGTELYTKDDVTGSLNVINYDGVAPGWEPRQALFPGIPLTGSVYSEERNQILRDMQALGAPEEIERGQAPGSVKTTSGLMLLSEEASRKREPQERAMVTMYQSIFTHYIQMLWAYRREDASYDVQKEGGVYELESYSGTDLLGDLRVKMEPRVGYDQTLYNKEAASEALTLGLYKLDSPAAVDRILELMKLPKDVNENQTLQITRAEQAYSNFLRDGKVPNIDTTLYDAATWYAVLGKRWHEDDSYIKQQECGWPDVVPAIVGWQQKLAETTAAEAVTKPIYGKFPPSQWPQIKQAGDMKVKQSIDAYEMAQRSFQATTLRMPPGAVPPPPPTPPTMMSFPDPPNEPFLPEPIEQKVYTIFRRMLPDLDQGLVAAEQGAKLGGAAPSSPQTQQVIALDGWLRMRSVIEGFRMLATAGAQGAMPGAPPVPGAGPPGAPPPSGPPAPTPGAQAAPPPQG